MLEARRLAVDRESSTWQGKSSTNNIRQPPQTPLHHHMSAMRPVNKSNQGDNCYVIAKYDYVVQSAQELDLRKNDRYLLLDDSKHWWKVQNGRGFSGYVPSNYVKKEKPSLFDRLNIFC